MRAVILSVILLATPVMAQSQLNPAQLGNAFCAAILAGDRATLVPLLTPALADLTDGRDDILWHTGDLAPVNCMAVGARGTVEAPEAVLFLTFPAGKTASDRLILNFVDGQLRIDDVAYDGDAGTMRARLAVAVTVPPVVADEPVGLKAEQIGQIFCLSRLGSDEGAITGLLSPDLSATLDAAWSKSHQWATANPGEKPPLGDGIPWQAWPDYAAECTVGLATLMQTDAKVEISYGFPDSPDADFTDTLLLKRLSDETGSITHWRIDDVAYATGGDLRAAVADSLAGL